MAEYNISGFESYEFKDDDGDPMTGGRLSIRVSALEEAGYKW